MDKLLTLKETEELLNVSKSTLQRWDNSGKLVALRTEGGHRRYKLSDIEKILGKDENDNNSDNKEEANKNWAARIVVEAKKYREIKKCLENKYPIEKIKEIIAR